MLYENKLLQINTTLEFLTKVMLLKYSCDNVYLTAKLFYDIEILQPYTILEFWTKVMVTPVFLGKKMLSK